MHLGLDESNEMPSAARLSIHKQSAWRHRLTISKGLVELIGGKILAEREPGKGSIFSFNIEAEVAKKELVNSDSQARTALRTSPIRSYIFAVKEIAGARMG